MIITILQVYPTENYKVYLYFSDGKVKLYDVEPLLDKGVFRKLQDNDYLISLTRKRLVRIRYFIDII